MKLSTKCRYGARAMVEIARNHLSDVFTKRKDITEKHGIPASYLENILLDLRNAGLLYTVRGPRGGFKLTKSPDEIMIYDVLFALCGNDLLNVNCVENQDICERSDTCIMRKVWKKMQIAQDKVLKEISLQTLIEE
ncbi:MAG: Rrf2 family transcriptional regulator [Fibrobacter sp.]|nr:Rrf2 family transcriptional regulator [Fibrobacter sp.]